MSIKRFEVDVDLWTTVDVAGQTVFSPDTTRSIRAYIDEAHTLPAVIYSSGGGSIPQPYSITSETGASVFVNYGQPYYFTVSSGEEFTVAAPDFPGVYINLADRLPTDGTDATADLVQAITDAPNNSTLFFPNGTVTTGPFTVADKVLHLRGNGSIIKLKASSNNYLMTISGSGASRCTSEGITYDGNRTQQGAYSNAALNSVIVLSGCDWVKFKDSRIINGFAGGLFGTDASYLSLDHLDVDNCDCGSAEVFPAAGIFLQYACDYPTIRYCNVTNSAGSGIKVVSSDAGHPTATSLSPYIAYCNVDYAGVTLASDNCLGIECYGGTLRAKVFGCDITGPSSGTRRVYGISFSTATNGVMLGNHVRQRISYAFELADSAYAKCISNDGYDCTIGVSVSTLGATVPNETHIITNRMELCSTSGIQITSGTGHVADDNTLIDCGPQYLFLNGAVHHSTVTNNRCIKRAQASGVQAIYLNSANDCLITENESYVASGSVLTSGLVGVYLNASNDATVALNKFDGGDAGGTARATYAVICDGSSRAAVRGNSGKNFTTAFGITFNGGGNNTYEQNRLTNCAAGFTTVSTDTVRNNPGYNPVGPSAITPGASPYTYTAGQSPEEVYIYAGTVSDISKGGTTIAAASPSRVHLEPNQSLVVTYTVAPTMKKDVL